MTRKELLDLCHHNGYFPTGIQLGGLECVLERVHGLQAQYAAATELILEWKDRFPNRAFEASHGLVS